MKRHLHTLLIYLLFALPAIGQVDVRVPNAGSVASQEWVKVYLQPILQRIANRDTTGSTTPPVTPSRPCSGLQLSSLLTTSTTSVKYSWSGINVNEFVWTVKTAAGATVRSGSLSTNSTTPTITFSSIPYGSYTFEIKGLGCSTLPPPLGFTLTDPTPPVTPQPIAGGRAIYMNLTGYGFSTSDPDGMTSEWKERADAFLNLTHNGQNFKGINGIRINMKWFEYEPSEENYQDTKLLAALNWCIARGIKLSVSIIPWRTEGDGFVPEIDIASLPDGRMWLADGDRPLTPKRYMPSFYSAAGRSKFKRCVKHLAQVLKQYPQYVDYISTATAQTEEYQQVREEATNLTAGYSQCDKNAWAAYSNNAAIPYPASGELESYGAMMNSDNGRLWYSFVTKGLAEFHSEFAAGVREGGMRVCGMYAGVGAPTAIRDYTYKLNQIFQGVDIIYSSEGDANVQYRKVMATDVNVGTFPNADPAIEFDPEDVGWTQERNPPYGNQLNGPILYDWSSSFFRRGGKLVHFAMSFSPSNIPQLSEALYKLQTEFVQSSTGMTGMVQGDSFSTTIPNPVAGQSYTNEWYLRGGGKEKQVKVKIE